MIFSLLQSRNGSIGNVETLSIINYPAVNYQAIYMEPLTKYRTAFSITVAVVLLIIAVGVIFWARGFKPNFQTGAIDRTGQIVANSTPEGASVLLNDRLMSATDTTIGFLDPGIYKVKIQKEGYFPWEKEVFVRADLVTEINALLFPQAPEIKPLTATGAYNPTLSPDNSKIVFGVSGASGGVFILPLVDSPFAFRQNPRVLGSNTSTFDFSKAKFIWSPNSDEFIARFEDGSGGATANIVLNSRDTGQELRDITASLNATLNAWQNELKLGAQNLSTLAPEEVKIATSEANIEQNVGHFTSAGLVNYFPDGLIFSPDEKKILYLHQDGTWNVYDLSRRVDFNLPDFTDLKSISWYPDSEHLTVAEGEKIAMVEIDGKNKTTIFSGKYENGFVFAHPAGFRIILLTTLTQEEGTTPNLYSINLK